MPNLTYDYGYSEQESVSRMIKHHLRGIETISVGSCTRVSDPYDGTCSVALLGRYTYYDTVGNLKASDLPRIHRVPVMSAYNGLRTPKISVGDRGVVLFCKHSLEDIVDSSLEEEPANSSMFDLNDGLFIPVWTDIHADSETTNLNSKASVNIFTDKFNVISDIAQPNGNLVSSIYFLLSLIPLFTTSPGGGPVVPPPDWNSALDNLRSFF